MCDKLDKFVVICPSCKHIICNSFDFATFIPELSLVGFSGMRIFYKILHSYLHKQNNLALAFGNKLGELIFLSESSYYSLACTCGEIIGREYIATSSNNDYLR